MAAVLPVDFAFGAKRLGHGYTVLETVESNPFYPVGATLRGHEFHYTYMQPSERKDLTFAFRVRRGYAFDGQRDGLCRGNVLACYTHLHALGAETWGRRWFGRRSNSNPAGPTRILLERAAMDEQPIDDKPDPLDSPRPFRGRADAPGRYGRAWP